MTTEYTTSEQIDKAVNALRNDVAAAKARIVANSYETHMLHDVMYQTADASRQAMRDHDLDSLTQIGEAIGHLLSARKTIREAELDAENIENGGLGTFSQPQ